ncbi:MAG: hypothetical protein N3B21_12020 [Clostridia bacterium]|nr:hypothetical protein [Clostridia bacterium]
MGTTSLNDITSIIINIVLIPLLPVVTAYVVALLKQKTGEIESEVKSKELATYISMAENAAITAVTAVNQIYVDSLKKTNGSLSEYERRVAFDMARNKVLNIIGDTAATALREAYNDLDEWIDNLIECHVSQCKKQPPQATPMAF